MIHTRCLAILDTMWGGRGTAPGLFRINPYNRSGKRLYWLLGHQDLWVTNACREQVIHATIHGKPDPEWMAKNLQRLTYDLLLVCGSIAIDTFEACGYVPKCRVLYLPHPAARTWTKQGLKDWQHLIQQGAH